MPSLSVSILHRPTGRKTQKAFDQDSIIIGRLDSCDLPLTSKTVSRKHAELVFAEGDFYLVDLESGNGTFVNGIRLRPHEKHRLESGDTFRIEEFDLQVSFMALKVQAELEENTDSGIIEIKMIKKVLHALEADRYPSLEVLDDPVRGHKVYFTEEIEELRIGRDKECELCIPTDVVSRKHAVIRKKWGAITITDLGSKNHTFVNKVKVTEKNLKDGAVITVGTIQVLFRNPQEVNLESIAESYKKNKPAEEIEDEPSVKEEIPTQAPELAPEEPQASASEEAQKSIDPKPDELFEPEGGAPESEVEPEVELEKTPTPQALPLIHFFKRLSMLELVLVGGASFVLIITFWILLKILF